MRLVVTTPTAVLIDAEPVQAVRAEDASGAFGIWPGHADFLTVLAPSVVRWNGADGAPHYVAVRGGVLAVRDGRVEIAVREAFAGDSIEQVEDRLLAGIEAGREEERLARSEAARLQLSAMRHIERYLRAAPQRDWPKGEPP